MMGAYLFFYTAYGYNTSQSNHRHLLKFILPPVTLS